MVVNLCDQCIHLQLLCSCSSPRTQSTASKAKSVCRCDSIWAREEYAMETVEVWGRTEDVREKRSSMTEEHWNWRCWGENRWHTLSQVFTALLLLGNILTAERVKLWNGSCFRRLYFWFVTATLLVLDSQTSDCHYLTRTILFPHFSCIFKTLCKLTYDLRLVLSYFV